MNISSKHRHDFTTSHPAHLVVIITYNDVFESDTFARNGRNAYTYIGVFGKIATALVKKQLIRVHFLFVIPKAAQRETCTGDV